MTEILHAIGQILAGIAYGFLFAAGFVVLVRLGQALEAYATFTNHRTLAIMERQPNPQQAAHQSNVVNLVPPKDPA